MSGRHRVVKPRRRYVVALVVPVRMVRRWLLAARDATARVWERLTERARARFEVGDPFAGVHLDPQATAPDPIPTPAPVMESEPAPLTLTPEEALPVLHTQHPHLPVAQVLWHVTPMGVSGEVNPLDADDSARRRIVAMFADALAAPVEEAQDVENVTVYVTAEVGGVPLTVAAVIPHADTIPLRVYRESASTQETQQIPDEVLREVIA